MTAACPRPHQRRLGVLGGTFNPPHVGHTALARAAARELGLERVLLTPALAPPHKPAEHDPGAEHRLRMCLLAVADDPRLGVSTLELERPGPSYTVDTLRRIHADDPTAELTLIVGADVARTLGSWRHPREILGLARLAVAERDDVTRRELLDALAPLNPNPDGDPHGDPGGNTGSDPRRTVFLSLSPREVSSSMVRERAAAGEPIEQLVGAEVARYIAQHRLYGAQPPARRSRPARRSQRARR